MRLRFERFGAWTRVDDPPALVALDREGVRALGLDGGRRWLPDAPPTPPVEVHLAVTRRCSAGCEGCYLDASPDGLEPPLDVLVERMEVLRRAGVLMVALGGGEPLTRSDIGALAAEARRRGLTPVLTTSGRGLSAEMAAQLGSFAQVNVSYDGPSEQYAQVRGFDGAASAEAAIDALARAGVRVGVNVVLTRATLPALTSTLEHARALGAREAQLLRYKPAGRGAGADYLAKRLTDAQARSVPGALRRLTATHAPSGFSLRIDCSMVPFLSADRDLLADPSRLARAGIFGCEGGQALASVRVDGKVAPCSFTLPTRLMVDQLLRGHRHDADLARWRRDEARSSEPCTSCPIADVCKGGCQAVSTFVLGDHGPDPECPRVVDHRLAEGARPLAEA